jgi:hypothetical protein
MYNISLIEQIHKIIHPPINQSNYLFENLHSIIIMHYIIKITIIKAGLKRFQKLSYLGQIVSYARYSVLNVKQTTQRNSQVTLRSFD